MSSESEIKKCARTTAKPVAFPDLGEGNSARLIGKLSRRGPLAFTPSGFPQWEATVAVKQRRLNKSSVGYVQLIFEGEAAVVASQRMKVGSWVAVTGSLWSREFKDVRGRLVAETKLIVNEFEERTNGD